MPPESLAPGVYVEEIPPGIPTIRGVATSTTAFVGRTATGPTDKPLLVTSFNDFESTYQGLAADCPLGYAVSHFFTNGGARAWIARIVHRDANGLDDESAPITDADLSHPSLAAAHRGIWLLDQADPVNILCIPPRSRTADVGSVTWNAAIQYARQRRAFVIVDPPAAWSTPDDATTGLGEFVTRDANAALYFPRIRAPDPLNANQLDTFAPCGAVAGIFARTDANRGVWKGPAGVDAELRGVTGLATALTDKQAQPLNTLAINGLRSFPTCGRVVWGARTLAGADTLASEWKYVAVRRLALFIEESVLRGTRWAVFEPNAEPLWARLRLSVGAFLYGLWRQGAFQGSTQWHAYFVKCDATTTTPSDLSEGVVNMLVGFAPLKPVEFVLIRLALRTAPASA